MMQETTMPLTPKGEKILKAMQKTYRNKGGKKKARQVFEAMQNEGKLTGVEGRTKKKGKKGAKK
jgi:hypothetical protein